MSPSSMLANLTVKILDGEMPWRSVKHTSGWVCEDLSRNKRLDQEGCGLMNG